MSARLTCPECGKSFRVKEAKPGAKARCGACQSVFAIPNQIESSPPDEPDFTPVATSLGQKRPPKKRVELVPEQPLWARIGLWPKIAIGAGVAMSGLCCVSILFSALLGGSRQSDAPAVASPIAKEIVGYWKVSHGRRPGVVQFTDGGTVMYTWRRDEEDDSSPEQMSTAKYLFVKENTVEIREGSTRYRAEVEILSKDSIAMRFTSGCCIFEDMAGRLIRTTDGKLDPPDKTQKPRKKKVVTPVDEPPLFNDTPKKKGSPKADGDTTCTANIRTGAFSSRTVTIELGGDAILAGYRIKNCSGKQEQSGSLMGQVTATTRALHTASLAYHAYTKDGTKLDSGNVFAPVLNTGETGQFTIRIVNDFDKVTRVVLNVQR